MVRRRFSFGSIFSYFVSLSKEISFLTSGSPYFLAIQNAITAPNIQPKLFKMPAISHPQRLEAIGQRGTVVRGAKMMPMIIIVT